MKVTVNFGNVGVIVPCGTGDIQVRELMQLAITRYKKATGKDSFVTIQNLKSSRDGGILDPDDCLSDVADDREQIIAIYEEQTSPYHTTGDGTSGSSSIGTESPDLFVLGENSTCGNTDVEVTSIHMLGITPLQVRRGSEPALNRSPCQSPLANKRWSAALAPHPPQEVEEERGQGSGGEDKQPFQRGASHMSSLANRAELDRWGTAAERLQEDTRKDPVGGTGSPDVTRELVVLKNESGPLGIHVVPNLDEYGSEMGLVIQGVETGGRIHRDGRILVGDRIYEINGRSLHQVNFQQAQEVFKEALAGPELRLGLVRGLPLPAAKPPLEKGVDTKYATISSTRRVADTLCHNTRKIGRVLRVRLCKGPDGLGFSVTSRDNTSVPSPVYIRNILQQGAAVVDGRLQSGDRLLEVNGVGMTGKSQSEVVAMLRATPQGGTVDLVVSRQDPLPIIPLNIPLLPESGLGISITGKIYGDAEDLGLFVKDLIPGGSAHKDVQMLPPTPVSQPLPSQSAPQATESTDGKLRPNDQLVAIEGTSLLSMSNQEAMETLRNFLESRPKSIHLRVSRHPDMSSSEDSSQDQSSSANNTVIYMGRDELAVPGPNPVLERLTGGGEPPRHLGATDKADATIVSQLSLNEDGLNFERDGFGRQSMSEKRHAHLDAKNTDTYQKTKKKLDLEALNVSPADIYSEGSRRRTPACIWNCGSPNCPSSHHVGPSLGLRRSSSLESLQTLVYEARRQSEYEMERQKAVRGRGCNESFRAAVDRSYDAPPDAMDTVEEESETGSSQGGTLTSCPDQKAQKKKSIFKGIGQVLKFGKSTKKEPKPDPAATSQQPRHKTQSTNSPQKNGHDTNSNGSASRQERMQRLREVHQRKHQERQGQYPLEDREEWYEQKLCQAVDHQRPLPPLPKKPLQASRTLPLRTDPAEIIHWDRVNIMKEMERPGSRVGYVDPSKYGHYVNLQDLQHTGSLPRPRT